MDVSADFVYSVLGMAPGSLRADKFLRRELTPGHLECLPRHPPPSPGLASHERQCHTHA